MDVTQLEALPTLTLSAPRAVFNEADPDARTITFTVARSSAEDRISFRYAMFGEGDTPIDADDFAETVLGGSLTLEEGELSTTFVFTVVADDQAEGTERGKVQFGVSRDTEEAYTILQSELFVSVIDTETALENAAPTAIRLTSDQIKETAEAGTEIGALTVTDPNEGDPHSFFLIADANGLFSVQDGRLVLTGALDHEAAPSHTVTVRATDSGGLSVEQSLTVNVVDVMEFDDRAKTPSGQAPKDLSAIRDFDGNDLGRADGWKLIGAVDVQFDGDAEFIYVNPDIARWATVGPDSSGDVDFSDHRTGGETRVVGIYIDPEVAKGNVVQFSDFDSQQRFQNDLTIDNLTIIDGYDFDGDGLQEVYFKVNDGTAYLRALMHADGNIQYANYQNAEQVEDHLTGHGFGQDVLDTILI